MNDKNEDYFVKRSVTATENKKTSEEKRIAPTAQQQGKRNVSGVPVKQEGGAVAAKNEEELGLSQRIIKRLSFDYLGNPSGIDTVFLLILIMIIAVGTVMSFSASSAYAEKKYDNSYYFLIEHIKLLLFTSVIFLGVSHSPPELYKALTYIVTAVSIILLVLVLFIGVVRNGAKRWIDLPVLPLFQPSELAKLALVMLLALYFSSQKSKVESDRAWRSLLYGVIYPMMIFGVFMVLLYFENHFSAIIIFFSITIVMMFVGKTQPFWLFLMAFIAAAGIAALVFFSDYAKERLIMWRNPWADPTGDGWQTIQGLYAIASGGIFGVGLGNSIQKYGYVSEPQNDFIFTIICEELGFVGALAVIVLFAALIMRGFYIARRSPNAYTYYLVMGIMIKLALQVCFNIAVVTNLFPNTGISLPFFSSGGTQFVLQMIEMGLVLSVSRYCHAKK